MTFARMGRSMKKREIMPASARSGGRGRRGRGRPLFDRRHLGAGPGALDPADHDPVVGPEPFLDHPHPVDERAGFYRALLDDVPVVHREQVASPLVDAQRTLGDEKRLVADVGGDAQPHEHPRNHGGYAGRAPGVGIHGAQQDGARARVEPRGGEIEPPFAGVPLLALEAGEDRGVPVGGLLVRGPDEAQQVPLVHGEVDVDRVGARDDGERGGPAGAHEVAGGDQVAVHAAVEGRGHPGVAEVDARQLQSGPGLGDTRLGRVALGLPALDLRLGRGVLLKERELAVVLLAGAQQLGLGGSQLAFGLLDLRFVDVRLDGEEQRALLHGLAVLEVDPGQKPLDPGLELDLVHGLGVAGEVDVVGHRLFDRPGDRHRWRRGCDERVLLPVAPGRGSEGGGQQRQHGGQTEQAAGHVGSPPTSRGSSAGVRCGAGSPQARAVRPSRCARPSRR